MAQEPMSEAAHQLFTIVQQYMTAAEVDQVAQALQLAQDACQGVHDYFATALQTLRRIPPLEHALGVGAILAEMRIDAVGVAAGLIYETVDAELLPLEHVESALGPAVARVVDSMRRLNILERKKQSISMRDALHNAGEVENTRDQKKQRSRSREALRHRQAETIQKMLFAMAEDPRVVLLKLAYRLYAMRTIKGLGAEHSSGSQFEAWAIDEDRQEKLAVAQETREIYAPLAGRLGISRVEGELQDLAFEIMEPEKYSWIRDQVEAESKQLRSYVDRVCTVLREEMAKLGLKAEVFGRVKHLYSFYKKLQRITGGIERLEDLQSVTDFSQIQDLVAFRILVESTPDCYTALGHVHSLWKPKEGWIKDFIAHPKRNGYCSLHTTVFCLDAQLVEIQIRTFEMHEVAEYGMAIHWHYKDTGNAAFTSSRELLTWLNLLANWQRELRSAIAGDLELVEAVKDDILQEHIFVFTPKGEIKELPIGSTPVDFAYRVHTKVGDRCAGARIITNEGDRLVTRMVPLDYELNSGEIVDIVTSRTAHPTRDWLNFARTPAARSKIRRSLKIHERHINIQIGRERLDRELRILGVHSIQMLTEEAQEWLANEYDMDSFEDLLAAIGSNEVSQHTAAMKLVDRWQRLHEQWDRKEAKEHEEPLELPSALEQVSPVHLEVMGVSGLMTRLANCCRPLPGDEIVGFISRGNGAIIHRTDCRNVSHYRERDRERLIDVSWLTVGKQRYLASIVITARDRAGLIRDIATVVSEAGVNMTSVSTNVSGGKEVAVINATLEIDSLEQMYRLFTRLEKVKTVLHVERGLGQGKKK